MKKRIDLLLIDLKLAPSRNKAQEMIDEGVVEYLENNIWQKATSASQKLPATISTEAMRVSRNQTLKYVSRGGLKLEQAINFFQLNLEKFICLDCGQSTGGFTDCLLQHGASSVIGLDVGHNQLAEKIKLDSRVKFYEGVHVRDLHEHPGVLNSCPEGGFDLSVMDLSFISAQVGLKAISGLSKAVLCLLKPQFELGANTLDKKGIVKNPDLYQDLLHKYKNYCEDLGWSNINFMKNQIVGSDGNQEFFIFLQK